MRLEKVDRSAILDALRNRKEPNAQSNDDNVVDEAVDEEPVIPAFRLITEFKNGIYFYNIHEPTESWVCLI